MHYFTIEPSGDPFSRAWTATEYQKLSDDYGTYRGDFPHLRREALKRHIRRLYPHGAVIVTRWNYR